MKLFINIKMLIQVREESPRFVAGKEMNVLPVIENAYLLIDDEGVISDFGRMEDASERLSEDRFSGEVVDASGRMILPCWCDSHTHLVFAGDRTGEFVDKIRGLSYEEIAVRGGGILNSSKTLNETPEEELYEQSKKRLDEVISLGSGAVEIKSGYGLSVEGELKMLRVINRLKESTNARIKATFLGAHAIPKDFKGNKQGYIDQIINEMLPAIDRENLADYIDVFCEKGYFSVEDTERIIAAGISYGLPAKVHVNQFTSIGGVRAAVRYGALSVDHLEVLTLEDMEALADTTTMPVALPGCSFFLGIPYTPGRQIIDFGLPLAIATDFNPGSAPSGNMNFAVAAGCIKMKLTPEEAINAATINGAYAMGLDQCLGSITKGKIANVMMTKPLPSFASIPYLFGTPVIDRVFLKGQEVYT